MDREEKRKRKEKGERCVPRADGGRQGSSTRVNTSMHQHVAIWDKTGQDSSGSGSGPKLGLRRALGPRTEQKEKQTVWTPEALTRNEGPPVLRT